MKILILLAATAINIADAPRAPAPNPPMWQWETWDIGAPWWHSQVWGTYEASHWPWVWHEPTKSWVWVQRTDNPDAFFLFYEEIGSWVYIEIDQQHRSFLTPRDRE